MNKLIVSLLLTVGISVRPCSMLQVMPLLARRKPPYVAPVMARMATAWRLTFRNWQVRASVI